MISHTVPFFSQKTHITEPVWQSKGCGVTSLKMIMEYWKQKNPTNSAPEIATLISKGLDIKSYIKDVGWSHQGLVNLAHNFGYGGYNMDLAKINKEEAWNMLVSDLKKHPLVVSVHPKFDPQKNGGHLVAVTGLHNNEVLINDPDEVKGMGTKKLTKEEFLKSWKQRYIVVRPLI